MREPHRVVTVSSSLADATSIAKKRNVVDPALQSIVFIKLSDEKAHFL